MAKLNPVTLQWEAPTQNTDGSAITEPLSYRLMVDGADFLDFPGNLNPNGLYEAEIAPMNIPKGPHTLNLKAFYRDNPDLISDPSGPLEIVMGVGRPNPPTAFSAV